jgi:hypothetical protein
MRDLFSNIQPLVLWDPIDLGTGNTAKVSEIIDMQGANALCLIMQFGSVADADATFTVLVEHGDVANLSDNAAVADADLNGTELGAAILFSDDNKVVKIGYTGSKRYVRLTFTPAANTGAILTSAVAIRSRLGLAPNTTQVA